MGTLLIGIALTLFLILAFRGVLAAHRLVIGTNKPQGHRVSVWSCPFCRCVRIATGQFPRMGGRIDKGLFMANVGPLPCDQGLPAELVCLGCGKSWKEKMAQ